ncbi:MAG: hypothetical protein MUF54_12955 [Polyangiaceae bacterium]|nr:hypothetical protein [Polyangiaceae bacterium]
MDSWVRVATAVLVGLAPVVLPCAALSVAASTPASAASSAPPSAIPRTLQISDGFQLRLSEDAVVRRLPPVDVPHRGGRARAHCVLVERGSVDVTVVARPHTEPTPEIVNGELVLVEPARQAQVAMLRAPRGDVAIVEQGEFTMRVDARRSVMVNRSGTALVRSSRVGGPAEAKAYRLHIQGSASGSVSRALETFQPFLAPEQLQLLPGAFEVVVESIDAQGVPGIRSAPERLRVVSVSVPRGAHVADGGELVLPPGLRSVALHNAAGLEMTYGAGSVWIPAPTVVSLPMRASSGDVRLRFPGSQQVTTLVLHRLELSAIVTFDTEAPRWPADYVGVTVKFRAATSGVSAKQFAPVVRVTVGTRPVDVPFAFVGDELRGRIPPQQGDGPCVVRVEVRDSHGTLLGRNFIEVARESAQAE